MTCDAAARLRLASRLLAYPDAAWFKALLEAKDLDQAEDRPLAEAIKIFIERLSGEGLAIARQRYVAIFDHTPAASLHMSWHRYGNDRSQGKAMAALNGLYRTAGFEPLAGEMPDYLPRMLEFLSIAPEWACEALLDGFGPEIASLQKTLAELDSAHAPVLALALEPLQKAWPRHFVPRTGVDPTKRPMARPEPEPAEPLIPVPGFSNSSKNMRKKTGAKYE